MMHFFRKHRETIFIITIAGFLAGIFVGFGSYFFIGKTPSDAVVEVNGKDVPYRRYTNLLNQVRNSMTKNKEDITDEVLNKKKQEVIQQLIQEELFWQEAKIFGISVSNKELANDIQNYPAFQKDGKFSHLLYYRILGEILRETPRDFEESRRKQIAAYRLRQFIASSVRITEPELQIEYARANKGNMANYEKEREKFLDNLKQEKTILVFNEWFKDLNRTVKIKVNLDEIESKFQK
ncbi:MAG: SurA N-terminal domain-containing protein [Elusimicrobia bacterium]|nr:SurA N-terminal domain-containing protein [Elusimicrobiota bacterium]